MKLCKSHITRLQKVRNQLNYKQTMNYTILLLSRENSDKVIKATEHINKAINILSGIN